MPRTITLDDLQLILLSTAAARDDGSLLPWPASVAADDPRLQKAASSLVRRKLADARPVTRPDLVWRGEGKARAGLFITDAGRAAIGVELPDGPEQSEAAPTAAVSPSPRAGNKTGLVLGLLGRAEGATLSELIEATGWLPHTTRAALTGLRKKGHALVRARRGELSCYFLGGDAR